MIILSKILSKRKEIYRKPSLILIFKTLRDLFILMAVYCVLSKYFESNTWQEAIFQTWQTFTTVGYGNKAAETWLGQINNYIFATLGIAYLGLVISRCADYKDEMRERRRLGMIDKNPIKDGVVIFNFPGEEQMVLLIRELRCLNKQIGFCIVDERIEELPARIKQFENISFISGGMLDNETYQRANLPQNKYVYVFPSEPGVSRSDAITVNILKKIQKYTNKNQSVIYIQVDSSNDDLFADCQGRSISEAFEILALVQETTDKYTSVMVEDLFKNSSGVNPQTVTPDLIIGCEWFLFQRAIMEVGYENKININVLGIVQGEKTNTCPSFNTVISKGDLISVIAENGFDWENFEKKLSVHLN